MPTDKQISRIRAVLRSGSIVFGVSAIALITTPQVFDALLGFNTNADLEWSMRMIGITLVALAGNMFSVATRGKAETVTLSGKVMLVSACALGILTLMIPVTLNWFTVTYSMVGFGFSTAYAIALFRK